MPQKIVLFLPKKDNAGGAQFLFLRIAQFLSSHPNISIIIVDFSDGFIFKNASKIIFEKRILEENKKVKIYDDELLFTSAVSIKEIQYYLEVDFNTRILLWELGPYSFIEYLTLISLYRQLGIEKAKKIAKILEYRNRKNIQSFLSNAIRVNGILFMCGKNAFFNKYFFKLNFDPLYAPIPISENQVLDNPKKEMLHNKISICWMSRLVPIKTRPLYFLIDDIANFSTENSSQKIELLIVGLGHEYEKLEQYCQNKKVPYKMIGRIEGEKLDDFIIKNVDLAFSMGTSALEFAKNKIPSVLTIGGSVFKKDYFSKKKYRWLFDSIDYNLSAEPYISGNQNLKGFDEIVEEINQNKNLISTKCFEYVQQNHVFEIVGNKILQSTFRSGLKWKDIIESKILEKTFYDTFLESIFSIKSRLSSIIKG